MLSKLVLQVSQNLESTSPVDFMSRYQAGELGRFFPLSPGDFAAALNLPRVTDRVTLAQALGRYAESLGAPDAVFASLLQLEHPKSRAVLTGQQAGLLLGPNYSLAKAVTAIKLAKQLSTEDKPVVPIFWLASQDHDSAEINHSYLLDLNEELKRLELSLPEGVSAGKIVFETKWLEQIIAEIKTLRSKEAYAQDVIALLKRSAAKARSFADWFAAILYELLGDEGLIIINPLDADIAPMFVPLLEAELEQALVSSQRINQAAENLKALHVTPQLGRGEDATNLFIEEQFAGQPQRQLLRFDGRNFYTPSERYTLAELKEILATEPARITPAAGLRPITQDAVLPTAVMVVGPGELRYFAQLRGVYELHDVAMPLIWPRASVTVLEPPVMRIMSKYNLSLKDIEAAFAESRAELLLKLHGYGEKFERDIAELKRLTALLLADVQAIDPTLQRSVSRSEARIEELIAQLKAKTATALAKQDSIINRQFDRLKAQLMPNGTAQERLLSPFSFFLKFGIEPVMQAFLTLPPQGHRELRF